MKKLITFLLLLSFSLSLFAGISASSIFYADKETLEAMCSFRGLEIGSVEEMRNALYEYEGLECYSEKVSSSKKDYKIEILSADSLSNDKDVVTLTGDASISFREGNSSEKILYAGTIIVDSSTNKLTAIDNVVFEDKAENASLNSIYADIVTVFWDSGKIYVSEATTSSERKNSEDESVMFYTSGESLTYFPDGGILYENGYIASNPETRYSSIEAEKIAMLPGEDMFISNAWLSIGRVKLVYLPFFFFPGSRVVGNPAFGFDSSKGAFLNSTFEIFGINKDISSSEDASSFTAILKSGENQGKLYPDGFYYSDKKSTGSLASWAEKTGSYLSVEADAYSGSSQLPGGAVHLGIDGYISLLDSALNLDLKDGIALSSPVYYDDKLRYYGENTLSYSKNGLRIDGSFPFYSDDKVLADFTGRLYGFSLDPVLGQDPEFPSPKTSTISSYSRVLKASYSLPSKYTKSYLSKLSLSNLTMKSTYDFSTASTYRENGKTVVNPYKFRYVLDEYEFPSFSLSASGTIFTYKNKVEAKSEVKSDSISYSDIHLLSDPLLAPLYTQAASVQKAESTEYSASLKYSISETYSSKEKYSFGTIESETKSSVLSSKITLNASLSKWFSLQNVLSPSYTVKSEKKYSDNYFDYKDTDKVNLNNELTLKVPELGISYILAMRLMNDSYIKEGRISDGEVIKSSEKEDIHDLGWDKDSVTQHKLSFSKSYSTSFGTFTPSFAYTLKPLMGTLNPKLGYKYDGFTAAFSWKFVEDKKSESYKKDMISLSLGYSSSYLTLSNSFSYNSADYDSADFWKPLVFNGSISLRTLDKKWSITEAVKYSVFSSKYSIRDYFDSIKTTISIPYLQAAVNLKSDNTTGKVEFSDFNMKLSYSSEKYQAWKGRVFLQLGLASEFSMDDSGMENASFTITPSITFSVAEFIDLKFAFTSYNNSFFRYYDDEDRFSFDLMWNDLLRSFDFVGDGRRNTSFVIRTASLEAVHYMEDWDLHCKYSAEVVKSGTEYSLLPKFSVYLAWKTLPEIKVDEKWEQKYIDNEYEWVKSN